MKNITPLAVIYFCFAVAGLIVPWSYNLQAIHELGRSFTVSEFFGAGWTTPLAKSLTSDFMIGSTPVMIFMVAESLRLKMRYWGILIILIFVIAFAFSCPMFLCLRELKLQQQRTA
jgi:hypothetical protein